MNISPLITRFRNSKTLAAFAECRTLLEGATDLELPLYTPDIESGLVMDLALQEGQNCKTIVIRRVGRVLEMAWMELGSLQTDTGIFEEHDA